MREQKERLEAARVRDAILEGYHDAISGRTVGYRGDLSRLLNNAAPRGTASEFPAVKKVGAAKLRKLFPNP